MAASGCAPLIGNVLPFGAIRILHGVPLPPVSIALVISAGATWPSFTVRKAALIPNVTPINHIYITRLLESEGLTVLNPLYHQDETLNRNVATLFATLKGREIIDLDRPSR